MKRGTLKGVSFGKYNGYNELPESVLRLFLGFDKATKKMASQGKEVECVSEILDGAMQGRINLEKQFNLLGYAWTVQKNQKINQVKKLKKVKPLMDDADAYDEEKKASGVSLNQVSYDNYTHGNSKLASSFEETLAESELQFAISTIKNLNEEFVITYNVDLTVTLKSAMQGVSKAVEVLKDK